MTYLKRSLALLATAGTLSGCGYFMHPERRGNAGGDIAAGSLVGDLLWLIPGIVPGVVALVIDFTSGAIYTTDERTIRIGARDTLEVPGTHDLRVRDGQRVLARGVATGSVTRVAVSDAMRTASGPMVLEIDAQQPIAIRVE